MSTVLEDVAILLWHRFSSDHVETWEEERYKDEYRGAARAVLKRLKVTHVFSVDDSYPPAFERLTTRQMEMTQLWLLGQQSKYIAKQLNVAPNTVANTMVRVYRKLGVHNRNGLATMVQEYRAGKENTL